MNIYFAPIVLAMLLGVIFAGYTFWPRDNPLPVGGTPENAITQEKKTTCGITAVVTEGPYYVSGMPALPDGNLNEANLPGEVLRVSGFVYEGADTTRAIPNAVVDIWQADNDGVYHPNGNGTASRYRLDQLALRGFVTTNEKGYYEFTTIYPGEYTGRTRHIHIKVRAPEFAELTTQLIVPSLEGDTKTFDEDTVSNGLPECHLLAIDSSKAPDSTLFDFHLLRK